MLSAATCAALALSLAGCGNDDKPTADPTPTVAPALTVMEFRNQANALCRTAYTETDTIEHDSDLTTSDGAKAAITAFTDRIDQLVTDLHALTPPTELESGVTAMLDGVSSVIVTAKKKGAAFLAEDDPFAESDRQAVALGLADCAGAAVEPTADPTPLSAPEFKLQATAVCRAANTEMDALNPGSKPTTQELDDAYHQLGTLLLNEVDELSKVTPPVELTVKYAALLVSITEVANTVKEKGAGTNDLEIDPFAEPIAKAKALGLTVCGRR